MDEAAYKLEVYHELEALEHRLHQVLDEIGLAKAAVLESETLNQAEFLRRHAAATVANAARLLRASHDTALATSCLSQRQEQQKPQQQQPVALMSQLPQLAMHGGAPAQTRRRRTAAARSQSSGLHSTLHSLVGDSAHVSPGVNQAPIGPFSSTVQFIT